MPFRAAVLKGVRLAAILIGAFLCGLMVYRMVRATPAEDRQTAPPPADPPASPAVAESARPGPAYPPPPPQIHRIVRKRSPAAVAKPPVVAQDVSSDSVVEAVVVSEEKSTAAEEPAAPEIASAVQSQDPTPPGAPEAVSKPAKGGKRWLKAVGRFLHIGAKKDVPVEAVR